MGCFPLLCTTWGTISVRLYKRTAVHTSIRIKWEFFLYIRYNRNIPSFIFQQNTLSLHIHGQKQAILWIFIKNRIYRKELTKFKLIKYKQLNGRFCRGMRELFLLLKSEKAYLQFVEFLAVLEKANDMTMFSEKYEICV